MKALAQKEMILAAALEKFRQYGMRRVTMGELSGDLRISKKTLYRHFSGKEELVRACFDKISDSIISRIEEVLAANTSIFERLLESWRMFSRLPNLISPEMMADLKSDYPHIWRTLEKRRRKVLLKFETLLQDGLAAGEVRPQIHPKVAMKVLLATVDEVMQPQALALGEYSPKQAVETLATVLLNGVFLNPPDISSDGS